VIEGATLVSAGEIESATRGFTGANKDFADVQRALEVIERLDTSKGYSAVQVILPEQELNKGEVTFKVVEAKVGKIIVEGNKFFDEANVRASLPSLVAGSSPNVDRIVLRKACGSPMKIRPSRP
jgi:hemolysin activation/secretion protein